MGISANIPIGGGQSPALAPVYRVPTQVALGALVEMLLSPQRQPGQDVPMTAGLSAPSLLALNNLTANVLEGRHRIEPTVSRGAFGGANPADVLQSLSTLGGERGGGGR